MEKKKIGYYIKKEKKIDIRTYKNAYWYLDNLISTSTCNGFSIMALSC